MFSENTWGSEGHSILSELKPVLLTGWLPYLIVIIVKLQCQVPGRLVERPSDWGVQFYIVSEFNVLRSLCTHCRQCVCLLVIITLTDKCHPHKIQCCLWTSQTVKTVRSLILLQPNRFLLSETFCNAIIVCARSCLSLITKQLL